MKKFIDKLISRLEEETIALEDNYGELVECIPKDIAKEIVNQLAEEYKHCGLCYLGSPCEYQNKSAMLQNELLADKNGWITCEIRLPEQPEENPELDYKPLELYLVSIPGTKYPFRAFWNGKFFTDGWDKVDAVAWMPLPKPYQKEGE